MISIITVNFQNAQATENLLKSLEPQTDTSFDVFVVDNASGQADREVIGSYTATTPLSLEVLYSESNRGFSGGNNMAIRKALEQGSEWLVLLNNDTTVPEQFIEQLRSQLSPTPEVIGIPLREGDHVSYAGIVQWLRSTLTHVHTFPGATQSKKMRYAIGAGLAIHRDVFERIGLLDERYFLYFEDADFSMRAHRANVPVRFLQSPQIVHEVSQSTRSLGAPLLLRYHARNALLFNKKHAPWVIRCALPLASFYGIVVQFLKVLLMPSRRASSRAILDGILDFYANRFGHISSTYSDNRH